MSLIASKAGSVLSMCGSQKINTNIGTGYNFRSVSVCITRHIDTLNNDTRQTDTQHNDIWHNNNRHTDTHNNDTPSFQKLSLIAPEAASVLSMCSSQKIKIDTGIGYDFRSVLVCINVKIDLSTKRTVCRYRLPVLLPRNCLASPEKDVFAI